MKSGMKSSLQILQKNVLGDYDRTIEALQLHGKISLNLRLIISNIINQHQD